MTSDILFKQFREIVFHSPQYYKHFKKKYSNLDAHHLTGSMGALKLNDALLIPLDRIEHGIADKERQKYFIENLASAFKDFLEYVKELESKVQA